MAINLEVKKGVSTLNGTRKDYYKVAIERGPVFDAKKMQRNIAQATGVHEAQVHAVLEFMWGAVLNELEDGQTVQLGNITIQPSISAKTHDKAEDCSAKDVEVLRFNLIPSKELNAGRKAVTFSLNGKTASGGTAVTPSDDDDTDNEGGTPSGGDQRE